MWSRKSIWPRRAKKPIIVQQVLAARGKPGRPVRACAACWPKPGSTLMRDELNTAMKAAMRAQDKARLGTIRLILAAIKDRDLGIQGKPGSAAPDDGRISDADIAQLLATMIKQRRESIRIYEEAGRLELAQKEADEITVISEFLPRQLDDDEAKAAIKDVIAEIGATSVKDMGRVMAVLRERYRGQMDFGTASALVKELL
jgi:uncharacterized protein YqeY